MPGTDEQAPTNRLGYASVSMQRVEASNAIEYAYRDLGEGEVPLVLLQHFRGNLDNWDPALVDALAADRRVVAFDNVGVGATTGRTPSTVEAMAHDAIAFLEALDIRPVDLLGFSLGSFVAQEIALIRPDLLRRVVLASSAPQGAAGMHGWAPEVIGAVGQPETSPEGYVSVFFAPTDTSRGAGLQAAGRIFGGRTTDRDEPTTWQTRQAQYDAVCAWGIPNHSLLQRVAAIELPVFVANGDSDPMILPRYSHLLAGLLPDARVTIYPDSAHGFLFQHHSRFAADVHSFLQAATDARHPGHGYVDVYARSASGHRRPRQVRRCSGEELAQGQRVPGHAARHLRSGAAWRAGPCRPLVAYDGGSRPGARGRCRGDGHRDRQRPAPSPPGRPVRGGRAVELMSRPQNTGGRVAVPGRGRGGLRNDELT